MKIEEKTEKATCRVDFGNNQLGSSFWVSETELISAAHVVDVPSNDNLSIKTHNNESIPVEVTQIDAENQDGSGTDLALLEIDSRPNNHEILNISPEIPPIGSEVFWSGYARLFGESKIERQRFGWGKVASNKYGNERAEFFEVDGIFNPSHSGGPVISQETGEVVGVVSASAGAFDQLEQMWSKRSSNLSEAFKIYEVSTEGSQAGVRTTLSASNPAEMAQVQHIFDQIGIDYDVNTDEDGNITVTYLRAELPVRAGVMLSEMSQLLLDTARNTFQMGVGIASGGKVLNDLVEEGSI